MMDFHGFPAIGTSSECRNESRIHNTNDQCYEFWVHSDIANSFWLPENNENPSYKSPRISTIFGVVIMNLFVNIYQIYLTWKFYIPLLFLRFILTFCLWICLQVPSFKSHFRILFTFLYPIIHNCNHDSWPTH